jgi:hypothetical protein
MRKDIAMLIKMTVVALGAVCLLACDASAKDQASTPDVTKSQEIALQAKGQTQAGHKKNKPIQKHRRFKRKSLPLH